MNNTVGDFTRDKRDIENAGAHGSEEDRNGNKDRREAVALWDNVGPPCGNQSTHGWIPDQKQVVHNPYLTNKG